MKSAQASQELGISLSQSNNIKKYYNTGLHICVHMPGHATVDNTTTIQPETVGLTTTRDLLALQQLWNQE